MAKVTEQLNSGLGVGRVGLGFRGGVAGERPAVGP